MFNSAILIPTYKRADNLITYKTLRKAGYNGKIYLIVGDDDKTLVEYEKKYKNEVVVFSKEEVRPFVDLMDNFEKRNAVVFARNAMFGIAKKLKLDCFCVLDDDYNRFCFRRIFERGGKETLKGFNVRNISGILEKSFEYLMKAEKLDCFAYSQNGDFVGGSDGFMRINGKRKIMNAFFFKTDRPIRFIGSINEDLNASVYEGQRGKVFFTINDVSINQKDTQQNGGGADRHLFRCRDLYQKFLFRYCGTKLRENICNGKYRFTYTS